ncbi:MAG: cell division ATP-binding protein FtsE [Candidatus Pacebacteria bacterium]|nr:cell division ATP-binding protein FtsE [Candidatus Paceibacterota bacterium]
MITFSNVSKAYDKNLPALDNVDLFIKDGEFVSLVGKSGAGKSTLIKLLIGEEKPTKGKIVLGNIDIGKLKPKELPEYRRQIGIVFQDFKLLPRKNVYENVAFALEVKGRPQEEIQELVPQVLDLVGLREKQARFPGELSGGEKQRVGIARAIIHHPQVLIADEPTGNLDEENTEEIISLLSKINELGTTVILATHNRSVVNLLRKRVITVSAGKIIRDEENSKYSLSNNK